jgi:phosphoribosylanthranilate isomerase
MSAPDQKLWVKICGVRDVETARVAVEAGANAIGLNFYEPSPRSTDVETARKIAELLPDDVTPVGLFVNHSLDEIERIMQAAGLVTLQLHGDETPQDLKQIAERHPGWNIIWARRVTEDSIADVEDELQKCKSLGVNLFACLLDPKVEGEYGGTGQTLSWKRVAQHYNQEKNPFLILAGGLTPDNVNEAVRTVHPFGVDVSSGIERGEGVKDAEMIRAFVRNARWRAT